MSHGKNRPSSCPQSSEPLTALSSWLVFCGHVKEISQRDFTAALYWNWITCNYILGPTAAEKTKKKALSKKKQQKNKNLLLLHIAVHTVFLQDSCKNPHLFSFLIETPPHSWFDKSVISEPIPRLIMTRPFIPSWHKKHYAPAHVTSNSSRLSKENDSHMRNVQKKKDMFITFWRYELLIWQLG